MSYAEAADGENVWTLSDARTLEGFLTTDTGKKLSQRLSNYAIRSATAAVRQTDNHGWHSGKAAGVFDGINAIQAHLPQTKKESQPELSANEVAFVQKYAA